VTIATWFAASKSAPVLTVNGQLTEDQKAYLSRSAATIDTVYIIDANGAISGDVEQQIGALTAGPLGFNSATNPVAVAQHP